MYSGRCRVENKLLVEKKAPEHSRGFVFFTRAE